MVICDLPYGVTSCRWDTPLPLDELWFEYKRVIKDNGAIVLTASQPFTTTLINSNMDMFRYSLIWNKKFGIPSHAKIRPMKIHEDILIFCRGSIPYNPQMIKRDIPIKSGGNNCNSTTAPLSKIEGWKKTYDLKYPVSILDFPREIGRTVHPTQKPVALFEYLIKTYTNEGDLVLDNCAGSGTTGVACENLNRNSILMEQEPEYCQIIRDRMATEEELKLEQRKQTSLQAFKGQQTLTKY